MCFLKEKFYTINYSLFLINFLIRMIKLSKTNGNWGGKESTQRTLLENNTVEKMLCTVAPQRLWGKGLNVCRDKKKNQI